MSYYGICFSRPYSTPPKIKKTYDKPCDDFEDQSTVLFDVHLAVGAIVGDILAKHLDVFKKHLLK